MVGKPGPVDDWAKKKEAMESQGAKSPSGDIESEQIEIEFDEKMSFGSSFDPSEWA